MIEVKFEPRDILSLELALTKLDAEILLKHEWGPFLDNFVKYVKIYPPEIPGSSYVRTHHLEESWTSGVVDPLTAQVINAAIYAGWVQGHEQTATHAGHKWTNAFEKGKAHLDYLAQTIMEKAIRIWTQ